ncbi:Retrotransposon-derived protein PEG10 [Rhizoctonia solani]|uniref:Retrotransposon-derived protein PEG10 n=1 Tax=Rhizoctonia solani TaxID=456999 RepID=A0A8H8NLZ2_9AGAM|nr:Retrotransposon-derived protein PEG10 [Rhizoctonia solani]QRW15685.1 Retrotransposon-derived protein PEG10 [Rhizoctonia solani]
MHATCSSQASSHAGHSYLPTLPWLPAPSYPLEPAPLSIRESWDPTFQQPPLSSLGIENLEQKVEEVQEAGVKACTNLENVSQAVDGIKDGLRSLQGPTPLEGAKPKHPPKDSKTSKSSNPARGTSTSQQATSRKLSNNSNYVLEEDQNCCHAAGACIKCSKMGHKLQNVTLLEGNPYRGRGQKEAAKIGKESGPTLGKD